MASANKRLQPTLNSGEELVLLQKLVRVRRFLKALRIDPFSGLPSTAERGPIGRHAESRLHASATPSEFTNGRFSNSAAEVVLTTS